MTIFVTGVGIISAAGKGEEETLECFYEGRRNADPCLFLRQTLNPLFTKSGTCSVVIFLNGFGH